MSKFIISEPQFLKIFDKLMQKELDKITLKTSRTHVGWFFYVDNRDNIIFTYIPVLNTVHIDNELFYRFRGIFDLTLSDYKKLMRKWLHEKLDLPEDIKVDFA